MWYWWIAATACVASAIAAKRRGETLEEFLGFIVTSVVAVSLLGIALATSPGVA